MNGNRFHKLVIVKEVQKTSKHKRYECLCDCGTITYVNVCHLRSGHTKSCGCLKPRFTHKLSKHPLYNTWKQMIRRCYYEKSKGWENYGGRGITVCDRWKSSFPNFLEDMGEKPIGTTLDRIDPNGNYEPSNCRWATISEQNKNKRKKGS